MMALFLAVSANSQVILPKIDTTVKVGKVGYTVDCRNKKVRGERTGVRPMGL